jgi:hypothetical protein
VTYFDKQLYKLHIFLQAGGLHTPQNRFLFARCAVDLMKDFEAEAVIQGSGVDPRKEVAS